MNGFNRYEMKERPVVLTIRSIEVGDSAPGDMNICLPTIRIRVFILLAQDITCQTFCQALKQWFELQGRDDLFIRQDYPEGTHEL